MTEDNKRLVGIAEKCIDVLYENNCTLGEAVRVAFAIVGASSQILKTDPALSFAALATMCEDAVIESKTKKQDTN